MVVDRVPQTAAVASSGSADVAAVVAAVGAAAAAAELGAEPDAVAEDGLACGRCRFLVPSESAMSKQGTRSEPIRTLMDSLHLK